jgi:poly(3-hydroxybutyrate) depolymerase
VQIGETPVRVTEQVVVQRPFGTLLRFEREDVAQAGDGGRPLPRVLVVAPMSGHFATLLRDTVRTLVADHDVYVTDWESARDIPLRPAASG